MIFQNIDKYLESLDLNSRITEKEQALREKEETLKQIQMENQRLTQENEELKSRERTRDFFNTQRENKARELDATYQRQDNFYKDFQRRLDGTAAEAVVKQWMKNPGKAPEFFKEWLDKSNLNYLYRVIDNPRTWSIDLRNRVASSLKTASGSGGKSKWVKVQDGKTVTRDIDKKGEGP